MSHHNKCTGLIPSYDFCWITKDDDYNLTYCNSCKIHNNLQNLRKCKYENISFTCDGYKLKQPYIISLFKITLWSDDLKLCYEYNSESKSFKMPTNTKYAILINSNLTEKQYYSVNIYINDTLINGNNEPLPYLYKTNCLFKTNCLYINGPKDLYPIDHELIITSNNIKFEFIIYNMIPKNTLLLNNTFLGEYIYDNKSLSLKKSILFHKILYTYDADIKWNSLYMFEKMAVINNDVYIINDQTNEELLINNSSYIKGIINNKIKRDIYDKRIKANSIKKYEQEIKLLYEKIILLSS